MRASVAPHWAGYASGLRGIQETGLGGPGIGLPLLPHELGPDARVVVEIAWGADPNGNPELWSWTDITGDVYQDPGISFSYGRANEATDTQPADGNMRVDNTDALYSLGGISPNWPNVKENVPLRVRVDPNGTGFVVAFQGNVLGFTPSWDTTGDIAVVDIKVKGTLHRLIQGTDRKISAPRRFLTGPVNPAPIVYYPLDEGQGSESASAAIGTGTGRIDPIFLTNAGDSTVKYFGVGKLAYWLPEGISLNKFAILRCPIPATPILTEWALLDVLVSYVEGDAENGHIESISLHDGTGSWGVRFDAFNKEVTTTGYVPGAGPVDISFTTHERVFDGDLHHVRIWIDQEGTSVRVFLYIDDEFVILGTMSNAVLVQPEEFLIFSSGPAKRYFGHAAYWNNITGGPFGVAPSYYELGGIGGFAIGRLRRVCEEDRIPLEVIGDTGDIADTAAMGPQPTKGIVGLARECEKADQGVLFDGLGPGLVYACRAARENAEAALTIDLAAFELYPELRPAHDASRRVNLATAKRDGGKNFTFEDVDGPLGTATIGAYDADITVNVDDERVGDFASWLVNLGTVEGYRYPAVSLNIRATPHLAPLVLALRPGHRIDLINVDTVLRNHPTSTVSLIVEGVAMTLQPTNWVVTLQCSSFEPWRIITLAADTGDTSPTLCHLDTDGSQLTENVDAGATSLTVQTITGPVWTQDADDFPFDVAVGGIKVQVTGVTGASSPQTFTVDPMPRSRPAGSPIEIWQPPVLRL